jgi:hypothetical protein
MIEGYSAETSLCVCHYPAQFCLSVTRNYPGCEDGASEGTLKSVFLATDAFAVTSPLLLSFRDAGNDAPDINRPWCTDVSSSLTSCEVWDNPPSIALWDGQT